MKALCIISGGMDSALAAYIAKEQGYELVGLHFDYHQRTQTKERQCFEQICKDLGIKNRICIKADFIKQIGGNALTDTNLAIPKNALDDTQTPITYVPFRNGIFLSIAASVAEVQNCEAIFIGVVEEDSSGYADCTQAFIKKANAFIKEGTATTKKAEIHSPLLHLSKGQIVAQALKMGVFLEHTWSCYERSDVACGTCDSCLLRLKGFKEAQSEDKIPYLAP